MNYKVAGCGRQLFTFEAKSYILNSISAYRSLQKIDPELADQIFLVPALRNSS